MKKYWKSIAFCICLLIAIIVGVRGCEIKTPEDKEANSILSEKNNEEIAEDENKENIDEEVKNKQEETTSNNEVRSNETISSSNETKSTSNGEENTSSKPPVLVEKDTKEQVTLSITYDTILNNMDKLNSSKKDYIKDGVVYKATKVDIKKGETVLDLLKRVASYNRIHIDINSGYIRGVNNIYERDCGELSGWMYSVNGKFPNYGAGEYKLNAGDVVEIKYTCDLGKDIGGGQ
ncbi:DUF4430 domain-containing protein [Clostridium sp. LP20]|uniref:DUF4430 domain-containing protein n=1 Tax=Clostridium sp. LP20 TaxID=3418665 RepID=UPI003EE47C9C